jgi:hypothetical protein
MNLGSLQIKDREVGERKDDTDEGGGGGSSGGGGFGKIDKAALGKAGVATGSAIDNLVESEKAAGEEEYRTEVNPDLERLMGFSGFKTNKKEAATAAEKKAQQFDIEVRDETKF